MSEDIYNNEVSIDTSGVGNLESWPETYDEDNFGAINNNYFGTDELSNNPTDLFEGKKHPFELEVLQKGERTQFICYYGVLYFSIAAIQVEGFDVGGTTRFGIKGQSPLPSFGNITPASFIGEKGENRKFSVLSSGGKFGTVYLKFYLDAVNHTISECTLSFIPQADEIPEEEPCGKLEKVNNKLLREAPNKGRYHIKIGSFNKTANGETSITQSIEDHLYYATTIVDGSEAPSSSDGGTYSLTTTATDDNPAGTFEAPRQSVGTNQNNLPTATNNPNFIPLGGSIKGQQPNQPNPEIPSFDGGPSIIEEIDEPSFIPPIDNEFGEEPSIIETTEHTGGFFGGFGAAGSSAPTNGTGYVDTGSISSISSILALQENSPQGSDGGTPSSST